MSGGHYIKVQSLDFDIIFNILVAISRQLTTSSFLP